MSAEAPPAPPAPVVSIAPGGRAGDGIFQGVTTAVAVVVLVVLLVMTAFLLGRA